MEILNVQDICKTYVVNKRSNNVLRNVSMRVEEGEFVAIMGPSGSGKSTLLYTISGMDSVTSGSVHLCGSQITAMNEANLADLRLKKMGFIFQQMHMLHNLCVYDNVVIAAYTAKLKARALINEEADALFRKFDIFDISDHQIHEVSGGQLQRACIARALMNQPSVVFADEPTGALNSKAAKEVMDALATVHAEGTSILMVTHDMKVAACAQRVLYIIDGGIQSEIRLQDEAGSKQKEAQLHEWLMKQGW